jgi:hypothetical protein
VEPPKEGFMSQQRVGEVPSAGELVRIGSQAERVMWARTQLNYTIKDLEVISRRSAERIGEAMAPAQAKAAEEAFERVAAWWARCREARARADS